MWDSNLHPATLMCSVGHISGDLARHGSLHLAVAESRRQHGLGVGLLLSSWNSKFPPMRWANGPPLDVKFDQRNVVRSSYLIRSLIPSFGRTWCPPRPWYCHTHTYHAAGLLQDGTSPQPSSKHFFDRRGSSNGIVIHWRTWCIANDAVATLWWRCSHGFLRRLCALVRCIPMNGPLALSLTPRGLLWIDDLESQILIASLNVSLNSGAEMNQFRNAKMRRYRYCQGVVFLAHPFPSLILTHLSVDIVTPVTNLHFSICQSV